MALEKRKPNRLKNYDYSSAGAYFITVCTENRRNLLWKNVGANIVRPCENALSKYGEIVKKDIDMISEKYEKVSVDKYVIMPNHIHLIIVISADEIGRPMVAPTISRVVKQLKGAVTKECGFSVWQKGFHDHIIRGENDYNEIWEYIESNPSKWSEDELFSE